MNAWWQQLTPLLRSEVSSYSLPSKLSPAVLQQHSAFSPPSSGLILVICHAVGVTLKVCLGVWGSGSGYKGEILQMVKKQTKKKQQKNTDGRICCGAKELFIFFFSWKKKPSCFYLISRLCFSERIPGWCLLCSAVTVCECSREAACVLCCSAIDCMKPERVGMCVWVLVCVCVSVCVCVRAYVCVL